MNHICPKCSSKTEYRLMHGSSYEGISIREVCLNNKDEIESWSSDPILPLVSSRGEIIEAIIESMRDMDDMLSATKHPILNEADLESRLGNNES